MTGQRGTGKRQAVEADKDAMRAGIIKHRDIILSGKLLAIDPSSVSSSSNPGYALFLAGNFVECGYMSIQYHRDLSIRLRRIREAFESSFSYADIVIIEKPSFAPLFTQKQAAAKGRPFLNLKSIASLQRACGASIAAFRSDLPLIEISPVSWSAYVRAHPEIGYEEKSDSNDAMAIGYTIIGLAKGLKGENYED